MSEHVIRLEKARVVRAQKTLLDLEAFRVDRGEIVAVVGPNGSGKTTLLRILALLDRLDEGRLHLFGLDVSGRKRVAAGLRRRVAMVLQKPYFFRGSVVKNVLWGLKAHGRSGEDVEARAKSVLAGLGLDRFTDHRASTLSGGEARRLSVARAMVLETDLLLLDEPTAEVDEESRDKVESALLDHHGRTGGAVVLSTHDTSQAQRLGARVVSLLQGRVRR